jgi:acyl-coenzyme A synthetase/AMP-(fatty) acid ligase
VASRDEASDGDALKALLETHGATVMQATPATWRMLIDVGWSGRAGFKALVGGEALPVELARRLIEMGVEVWNMYGPTETTVWSTCGRVVSADDITIGRPIANTSVHTLDRHDQQVPIGVPGEACIGGAGVALGYHNRAELTADRFITGAPGSRNETLYRTGDLVRWRADGRLEHLGRIDRQLKVNGFRIEPGDVESHLANHPSVAGAVVDARGGGGGDLRLVAYVVLAKGADLTTSEARRWLRKHVPDYMVPGIVTPIPRIPLTPNGKVDRNALPDPFASVRNVVDFEPPSTPGEEALAAVWRDFLGVERVGRHDNFFELGGHSLLALRAVSALQTRTGHRVDTRRFFFQTLSQIAGSFAERSAAAG